MAVTVELTELIIALELLESAQTPQFAVKLALPQRRRPGGGRHIARRRW